MSKVTLHPGADGDEHTWMPEITLEHDGQRDEMYVIVGEEAGGMIEGIGSDQFAEIAKRLAP
jgi:hypothetical protein